MIKGLGYLKYLKQSLIGFGISCFILLGGSFVNASVDGHVVPVGTQVSSEYNSNYKMYVNGQSLFLTSFLGEGKQILMSNIGRYFFFLNDGTPYIGNSTQGDGAWHEEGVPGNFLLCDSLLLSDVSPSNCQNFAYTSNSGYVTTIFKNMDKWYYGTFTESALGGWNGNLMCFSSESIGNSVCFYSCSHPNCGSSQSDTIGGVSVIQNLSNSQDFGFNFSDIPVYRLGSYPGVNFNGGSIGGDINSTITGDYVYYDCTWNDIILALESEGYNRYVCYGGLDNFDLYDSSLSYNPIPGTGRSVGDIWAWHGSRAWDNFPEWFNFWNGLYTDSSNNYNAMWESYPAVYRTYFQLYNTYKGSVLDPRTILEYCQILTFTGETLTHSAGGYFKPACETVIIEKQTGLWESRLNGTLYSGGIYTGDVPIGVNWNGVGNMSGETLGDGLSFIQNFFNLAKSKISTNFSSNFSGVLPGYILVFLLAIILFRFLRH